MGCAIDITSWDFQDLDWENPDPLDARYVQAVCNAVIERLIKVQTYAGNNPRTIAKLSGRSYNALTKTYYESCWQGGLRYTEQDLKDIYTKAVGLLPFFVSMFADPVYDGNGAPVSNMRVKHGYGTGAYMSYVGGDEVIIKTSDSIYGYTVPTISARLTDGSSLEIRTMINNTSYYTSYDSGASQHIHREKLELDLPLIKASSFGHLYTSLTTGIWQFTTWTEHALMKFIGATEIYAYGNPFNPKEWLKQMYAMINQMTIFAGDTYAYYSYQGMDSGISGRGYKYCQTSAQGPYTSGGYYAPSTSFYPPAECPSLSDMWNTAVFGGPTVDSFLATAQMNNSWMVGWQNMTSYARQYFSPSASLTSYFGMVNSSNTTIHIHAECWKVIRAGIDFNNETGIAENDFITLDMTGVPGDYLVDDSFGYYTGMPADGVTEVVNEQELHTKSKGWSVPTQLFYDNDATTERNYIKLETDTSQGWNFKTL